MYKVLRYLNKVYENRQKPEWFEQNRNEFAAAQSTFACDVNEILQHMAEFDPSLANIPIRDCLCRFQRRLSDEELRARRHHAFCAVLTPAHKGKHCASYLFNFEPDNCYIAAGIVNSDTKFEKIVRDFIIRHLSEFERITSTPEFKNLFPEFGQEVRQKYPRGLQRDSRIEQYMYIREFVVRRKIHNRTFSSRTWRTEVAEMFRAMHPLVVFLNAAAEAAGED